MQFVKRMNVVTEYEFLRNQPESYWRDLLNKYLIGGHCIIIRGYPSVAEQKRMAEAEADRLTEQRKKLGKEGLERKKQELLQAIEANEGRSPGIDVLTSVPVPSVDDIHFHSWSVYRPTNEVEQNSLGFDLNAFPFYTECYDLKTNFVYLMVSLDTQLLPATERLYLPLLLELAMESPIEVDGVLMPYEDVVMALESDTVSSAISLGLQSSCRYNCGPYSNYAFLTLQVVPEKYAKAVQWLRNILYKTVFTPERIKVCAAKLANEITQEKRMGENILFNLLKCIVYKEETNVQQVSLVVQQKFLQKLLAMEGNLGEVVEALTSIRAKLTIPSNVMIHLAADFGSSRMKERDVLAPWLEYMPQPVVRCAREACPVQDWMFIDASRKVDGTKMGAVVGMGSVESSFLLQAVPFLRDFMHEDLPAVMLFLQYLTQLEGSMWRQIRGKGLAYAYSMLPKVHEGLLTMQFYKATNVVGAYKEARDIVENLLAEGCLDQTLFESARSSLIFEVIEREKNVGDLPGQAMLSTMKQVVQGYNRHLVSVSIDSMKE